MWIIVLVGLVCLLVGIIVGMAIAGIATEGENKRVDNTDLWRDYKIAIGADPTYNEYGELRHGSRRERR